MADQFSPYDEMEVNDEYVPEELFSAFVSQMPQVCVEVIVETDQGVLLAKRDIEPPIWFWPGSRLYKGEELDDAAHRVAAEELGIEVAILEQYGPYAHFWDESSMEGSPTRHTVNVVYHVEPADEAYEIELDEQHSAYRFVTEIEPGLHEYVRRYLDEIKIL